MMEPFPCEGQAGFPAAVMPLHACCYHALAARSLAAAARQYNMHSAVGKEREQSYAGCWHGKRCAWAQS